MLKRETELLLMAETALRNMAAAADDARRHMAAGQRNKALVALDQLRDAEYLVQLTAYKWAEPNEAEQLALERLEGASNDTDSEARHL